MHTKPFSPFCAADQCSRRVEQIRARELAQSLLEREQVEQGTAVVEGFNFPPRVSMPDFKVWSDVEPSKGTMNNYPIRPWHNSGPSLAAYPAPPDIAVQILNRATIPTTWAKLHSGQSIPQVMAWAKDEVHGCMR
jgi:hypothetical protein